MTDLHLGGFPISPEIKILEKKKPSHELTLKQKHDHGRYNRLQI